MAISKNIFFYRNLKVEHKFRGRRKEVRNEQLVQVVNESKNMICTSDGKCFLPDYFDMLIEKNLISLRKKYWE